MLYLPLMLWTVLRLQLVQGLICICDDPDHPDCKDGLCEISNGSCATHYNILQRRKLSRCEEIKTKPGFRDADVCSFPLLQLQLIISMCCDDMDLCNERFDVTTEMTTVVEEHALKNHKTPLVAMGVVVLIVFGVVIAVIVTLRTKGWIKGCKISPATSDICLTSSGSGHGQPILVERTIAREVAFKKEIGKGRYGTVWCGEWRGVLVAVKTFDPRESDSWAREVEIYQTHMLNHSNIVHFIASDSRDKGAFTQYLLITEYHPKGSLFDFLNENILDVSQMLRFAESITDGLNYLHREIVANRVKPCIAHRDLKSRNILVKNNYDCCIADLGLAVRHDADKGGVDIAVTNRVGTNRYMAPEVLDETISGSSIHIYKMADIYSLALVFWELFRRCDVSGEVDEYQVPYFDRLSEDPKLEEVINVVCLENYRPMIPTRIEQHERLSLLASWVRLCWHQKPEVRLTTLRILKNIKKMKSILPTVIETEQV